MPNLTSDAQSKLDRYLQQIRGSLAGCKSIQAEDVVRDVMDHIEAEFADTSDEVTKLELDEGPLSMFEPFTDRARKVLALANQEARRFNHEYIGTEHILLGLVKEGGGSAADALRNLDVDLQSVRREVEKLVKMGPEVVPVGKLPYTPRAKKVIEYAIEESRSMNHKYVGTEHLLLGLIREHESVAGQVLSMFVMELQTIREEVLKVIDVGEHREQVTSQAPDPRDLHEGRGTFSGDVHIDRDEADTPFEWKSISREQLVKDLKGLGIRPGDCVMLHSSLSRIGWVDGGASTVVEALLEAMRPEGTLITPAFTEGAWTEHLAMPDCVEACPQSFCPSRWPSHEGAIPNAALKRPGRLRSCHPTHSWVANGARAEEALKNHIDSETPCGRGNPFEAVCDLDGCIMTLGVGVDRITLWHYFEDLTDAPYKGYYHPKERHLSYCTTARRLQYEFPGLLLDIVRASGIMTFGKVGRSDSGVVRARVFRQFLATVLADDPYCHIVRPPDRESDDLAVDAMTKGARMLQAWRRGPRATPGEINWYPDDGDDETIREDCPVFAGFHEAGGERHALCRANGRHPELFHHGGIFNEIGKTACGRCPWHHQFPRL